MIKPHLMDEDKIRDIEIALAHQDQQIHELNEVITEQWKQIDFLRRRLDKALSKIERLEHDGQSGGDDGMTSIERAARDIPPHY